MIDTIKFIKENIPLVACTLGFAIIGYLGYHMIRWIIEKCHQTEKIDEVAQRHLSNPSSNELTFAAALSADHMQLNSLVRDQLNVSPMNLLLDELILEVFSHLSLQDLAKCRLIASKFPTLASKDDLVLKKVLQHMKPFGKEEWETFFGEVGKAPLLPELKVLKEVYKTYMLVLLPENIDGKPLTLNLFKTLAANPKGGGNVTKITVERDVVAQYGDVANVSSRWVLFPKILLEGTRGKAYAQQKEIVAKKGDDYEVTRLFDAVVAIASRHVQLGECFFSDGCTRCQESINFGFGDSQVLVGASHLHSLYVYYSSNDFDYVNYGVAAVRK